MKNLYLFTTITIVSFIVTGCNHPRPRLGCYPTSTPGSNFVSSDKLGQHSYNYSPFENNGITYTNSAGHIDITHLRIAADHTKYIYDNLYKSLMNNKKEFSFSLTADKSKHVLKIQYPKNWNISNKSLIAKQMSLQLAQHLTFTATTWHEMLTWYGYKTMGIFPETPSAFSWEDIYSNLLGTRIAAQAIQDTKHSYNEAVTLALNQEMKNLGGQSADFAWKASEKVRGQWFDGNLIVEMKKRNIDIGLDDNYVTPMIVPQVNPSARPKPYPIPSSDISKYCFAIDYSIFPREFEKGVILKVAHPHGGPKYIKPAADFKTIIADIRTTAIRKYGPEVATAYDPDKVTQQPAVQIAADSKKTIQPLVTTKNKKQTSIEQSLEALLTML